MIARFARGATRPIGNSIVHNYFSESPLAKCLSRLNIEFSRLRAIGRNPRLMPASRTRARRAARVCRANGVNVKPRFVGIFAACFSARYFAAVRGVLPLTRFFTRSHLTEEYLARGLLWAERAMDIGKRNFPFSRSRGQLGFCK